MSELLRAFLENERGIKRFLSKFLMRSQDVDDIAQETFLRAFAAEAKHNVLAPRTFLYRVAKNLALNERARAVNALTDSLENSNDTESVGVKDQPTGEEILYSQQKMALFAEAVSLLPPQCRRVFVLRKVHGLSQTDIARRLGISAGTVEKHISVGLLRCRNHLRLRGYDEMTDSSGPGSATPGKHPSHE